MREERALVRSAAWLFIVAGIVTLVSSWLPNNGILSANVMDGLGLASIVTGVAAYLAPWERWHPRASLGLVGLALGLIAFGDTFGASSPYTYGVYFVVLFTWVGLCHPRRTSLYLAPVAVPFYLLPFLVHGSTAGGPTSVAVTIPVCALIGETVAWAADQMRRARSDAEHRAMLLRAVVRGTTTITALDRDQVLAGVVDSVLGLDLDSAWLAVFGADGNTWTVRYARGGAARLVDQRFSVDAGVSGLIRSRRAAILAPDYRREPGALPEVVALGIRSLAAVPVWVHGHLAAALVGASSSRVVNEEDAEALTLLANHAGRTLENAQIFGEERRAREILAEVSVRDELTGIGNRRHAVALLDSLQPGDAVVMIDLDHFKAVNDSEGHEAGDRVLLALADHLRLGVRDADLVARYGGEEFLVVLRGSDAGGLVTADRLCATWRDRHPRTTFSAGVAVHREGRSAAATLAQADAALYAAKRTGRDRVCEDRLDLPA